MGEIGFKDPAGDFEQAMTRRGHKRKAPERQQIEWPGGIKPWEPIDQADTDLGYQYRWVTPRRAVEIRREIEHG